MYKSLSKDFMYKAATINRTYKRLIMVLADLFALAFALWSGYALRLSMWWPLEYLQPAKWLFLIVPIIGVAIFVRLGLYRAVVRFMGAQAIWAVVKGSLLIAIIVWVLAFAFQITPFPRSIPINFALMALVYVGGSRLLVRNYYQWLLKHRVNKDAVLIYGAGSAGVQLATALFDGRELYPVGFIDDDSSLWKSTIKNLPIYEPKNLLEKIQDLNVKHVLLAVPHASNRERKRMLEKLDNVNIHIQTIPSMSELISGKATITQLREVQIEELLGRDPVPPKTSLMAKCINNKVVMVTGAGGSIGSELCRQVINQKPKALILVEVNEYVLYKTEKELLQLANRLDISVPIYALLGSVSHAEHIAKILNHFSVETIYHAAAYKHVPIVEHNVVEGVANNSIGTHIIASEAAIAKVENFILVSTDKAVRPTNIMGASKRFAEIILQDISKTDVKTIFSIVRFGNVLGSSGSVVPLFRKQIEKGGPITVTHPKITRYFMTIPEAAALVIQAGSMAEGGDVFVLDMGEPIKIIDLAKRLVKLSGLELKDQSNPDGDIEIQFTGLRPAEKLFEELLVSENAIGTAHSKIMRAVESCPHSAIVRKAFLELKKAADNYDHEAVRDLLAEVVNGYEPHSKIVDHMSDYLSLECSNRSKVVSLKKL